MNMQEVPLCHIEYAPQSKPTKQHVPFQLLSHIGAGDRSRDKAMTGASGRAGKENASRECLRECVAPAPRSFTGSVLLQSPYAPLVEIQEFSTPLPVKSSSKRKSLRTALIHQLPPEILGHVFTYCQSGWDSVSVESLMAVCPTWMGVCLGTPNLWTKIVLHMTHWASAPKFYQMRSNYVYHHLARSGILPLHVEINLAPRPDSITNARDHVRFAQAVLDHLFQGGPSGKGTSHWEELAVTFDGNTPRRLLDFLGTSMPRLQRLTIESPDHCRMPIMQLPALKSLTRVGCPEPAGHNPATIDRLSLTTSELNRHDVSQLSAYTGLHALSIIIERAEHRLPKLHLPNLVSLEITIKHSPSSNSLQISTEEPGSLRFLVLPRLHTLIVKGDNPSLIAAATLRNLDQVRKFELTEWEFLAKTSRRTKWGFVAHSVVQTPAMAWNPSTSVMEYLLSKLVALEELEGFPGVVKLVNSILHRRPDLRRRLRSLQSRYQGVLRAVVIKGSGV